MPLMWKRTSCSAQCFRAMAGRESIKVMVTP
jgi:hypothetical protein